MNRLRHPIRAIREPFGTAGLVIACVALIAALTGGAYAASGALTAKQKKEVKKIAKQYAGKPGAAGPAGPAGAAGAKGDKGDAGSAGAAGKDGTNGTNGTNGVSPVGTAFSGEQNGCKEGGVKFAGANTTVACNGVKGVAGKDGETGFTETLPPGKTETGFWAVGPGSGTSVIPLSFNIPLAEAPQAIHFVNLDEEEFSEETPSPEIENCLGSFANPTAPPGHVCVYEGYELGEPEGIFYIPSMTNAYRFGASFFYVIGENQVAWGSYAVTAAEP